MSIRIFGAPLIFKGFASLPYAQGLLWAILTWTARRRHPDRSWEAWARLGGVQAAAALSLEWCHNLAHAFAAWLVGKPTDEIRVLGGMPRLVYYDINDTRVTPREHILRALGGPVFNLLGLLPSLRLRSRSTPGTAARQALDAAVTANAFIGVVGLLPIPGIDGGPILKWSLVAGGRTPAGADRVVRGVNAALGAGLALGTAAAIRKRQGWLAVLLGVFAISALGYALGWIREQ